MKITEIGLFPEDWTVMKVSEISDVKTGPFGSTLHEKDYVQSGTPIITVEHLGITNVIHDNLPLVSDTDKKRLKAYLLNKGDIVFSRVGSVDRSALIRSSEVGWLFSGRLLRVRPFRKLVLPEYLIYQFQSEPLKQRVREVAVGQTMASLNTKILDSIKVIIPPTLKEQKAIAEVLSDMDAYIDSLEQLIAKKRLIKQGVMQELLTGKRRLPGFTGRWEERQLGEIGEISGAGIDKKIKTDESPIRLVNYLDVYHRNLIFSKDLHHWVTAPTKKILKCSVQKGDIFFTPTSEVPYDIANSAVAMEDIQDAAYSYHLVRLRLYENNNWDLLFRAYIFATRHFLSQAETMCEGSGTRYVITLKRFRELSVFYPTDIIEQAAIAEVLSSMDNEITTLENKLDKLNKIKEGMMQELLTGRIRLV
ncbi:restriction endonuclease subunit S [Chloroflexota bacterium]|nr:restriction endonuclease subunit S [Chloroflexota bacterium]